MAAAAQGGHAGLLGEGLHQSQLNLGALQQNSDINRSWTRTISRSSFQQNAKYRFFLSLLCLHLYSHSSSIKKRMLYYRMWC